MNKGVQQTKSEPTMYKKDMHWQIKDTAYVIRNTSFMKDEHDGEEILELDVSIAVAALSDLMVEDAIPHDVDYEDYADIE